MLSRPWRVLRQIRTLPRALDSPAPPPGQTLGPRSNRHPGLEAADGLWIAQGGASACRHFPANEPLLLERATPCHQDLIRSDRYLKLATLPRAGVSSARRYCARGCAGLSGVPREQQ
ncbi:hypothetical protein NDU88_005815 [Pleurodeles waltl]|uniref:Uncharacterized protein n=1 Tax=Pleurodeles waltl TaxID=8319 RepID=A0AAV7SMS3_PLEWA|nr:hypothetical protein NDU88_005815 [Pleurodeles waltl]